MPPHLRWLPQELAAAMRSQGARTLSKTSLKSLVSEKNEASGLADLEPNRSPPALRQHPHVSAEAFGFIRGDRVVAPPVPVTRISPEDFPTQWIVPGSYVITRAALSSPWARLCTELQELDFWVWRVLEVWPAGLEAGSSSDPPPSRGQATYLDHVFHPMVRGRDKDAWPGRARAAGQTNSPPPSQQAKPPIHAKPRNPAPAARCRVLPKDCLKQPW
jgi:hypothetical protein